jgi:hypothetical protein
MQPSAKRDTADTQIFRSSTRLSGATVCIDACLACALPRALRFRLPTVVCGAWFPLSPLPSISALLQVLQAWPAALHHCCCRTGPARERHCADCGWRRSVQQREQRQRRRRTSHCAQRQQRAERGEPPQQQHARRAPGQQRATWQQQRRRKAKGAGSQTDTAGTGTVRGNQSHTHLRAHRQQQHPPPSPLAIASHRASEP